MLPILKPTLSLLAAVRKEITVLALRICSSSREKMPVEVCRVPGALPLQVLSPQGLGLVGNRHWLSGCSTFWKRVIKQLSSHCFREVKWTKGELTASTMSSKSSDKLWTHPQGEDEAAVYLTDCLLFPWQRSCI